jgi:hypothetical protein
MRDRISPRLTRWYTVQLAEAAGTNNTLSNTTNASTAPNRRPNDRLMIGSFL